MKRTVRARVWNVARFGALLGAVAGCAGRPPKAEGPPPPPSAIAVAAGAIADEGCRCPDEACLRSARSRLLELESQFGGIDELPLDVYESHERFERCLLAGTFDLDLATKRLCSCRDEPCVRGVLSVLSSIEEKYRDATLSSEEAYAARRSKTELEACFKEKVGDGAVVADAAETTANATCACTSPSCAQAALNRYSNEAGTYLLVQHSADSEPRWRRAEEKICECFMNVVASSAVQSLVQDVLPYARFSGSVDSKCSIARRPSARSSPKR